jgi:NarL family two-component system response regulator LiaR
MTTMLPARLLLADDHKLFRQGLRQMLETKGGFTVVAEAENGQQAVELARARKPDVILMDIQMPGLDGVQATHQIVEHDSVVRVIILTMYRQDSHVFEAIKAGARGYLLKDTDWQELLLAVHAVLRGEALINPALASRVLEEFRRLHNGNEVEALTVGEMDVLRLVAHGQENDVIASQLALSEKTVSNRLSDIYRKLRVNNRTQAALYALRHGWTNLDDTNA